MVKFVFGTYEKELDDWTKHHEMIGVHVKRVYEDGEFIVVENEELRTLLENNEERLMVDEVVLGSLRNSSRKKATDYYLPLRNDELKGPIRYFMPGANNTQQLIGVRLKFLFEDSLFILDHHIKARGLFSLKDILSFDSSVEECLESACEKNNFEATGIKKFSDDEYQVVVVDSCGKFDVITLEVHEFDEHLIGIEIYEYEMEIIE